MSEVFGPAERLHAAIRRRAPQIAASAVRDDEEGLTHVRVTYRNAGPWLIRWDGTSYIWHTGPQRSTPLGGDPEEVAGTIAAALGVNVPGR